MKQIIFSALAIVGMFFFISCERHTWEDGADGSKGTKRLFPKKETGHGEHQGHHGKETHGKKGDHDATKKDAHAHAHDHDHDHAEHGH